MSRTCWMVRALLVWALLLARDVSAAESLRQGPRVLKGSDVGVGRLVADASFTDIDGGRHSLSDTKSRAATVIAMTSTSCPVSQRFAPALGRLVHEFSKRDVAFVFVNPTATDSPDAQRDAAKTHGLSGSLVKAGEAKALLTALDARTTTEVFVLDAARTLVYRGALDDQYGLGYSLDAPRQRFVAAALDALLAGRQPEIAATAAPGCELDRREVTAAASKSDGVTYHNRVSRIVQANCVECHRAGGVGPFSLESSEDVIAHAGMIRKQIERGAMPPWFAANAQSNQAGHSHWSNDRSLSPRDKADLLAWLASDRPLGDPVDAPRPRKFPGEWTIGTPDLIVQLPRPVPIKAEGTMPYQFVTAQTTLTEDRWVQGYEIIPTDRAVVHHVIVNVHARGSAARGLRDRDEGTIGYWAAYVPGNASQVYPAGFARKLPAGATISFQIHYTPNGRATQDQLRMGLIFANEPPRYVVETLPLSDRELRIPPGAARHRESTSRTIGGDLNVMAFMAHMHVRGQSFLYEVTTDGRTETLLDIPRYDFNWQLRYDLAEPLVIPRGSTLRASATFDNSADNPANPDPTRTVTWGPQTYDEMLIGYVEVFRPLSDAVSDTTATEPPAETTPNSTGVNIDALFKLLDRDKDGKLTREELPARRRDELMRLDTNGDGTITLEEAQRLSRRLRK